MTPFVRFKLIAALGLCLLSVAGCGSRRAPEFVLGSQTKTLVPGAQDLVRNELVGAFGTPSDLKIWSTLPVDFGEFTGVVDGTSGDSINVKLQPASLTAAPRRLGQIRGAVAVKDGLAGALRVASYQPDSHTLGTVSSEEVKVDEFKKGDSVKVIGDGLQFGRDLYLRHCMHCHGVSGDGDGPTAKYFAVKPRDYRKGVFKFTSTKVGVSASRDDLKRIVKLGVPGTYMPSFMLLPDDEVAALVEYVRWLSMRGQMENKIFLEMEADYGEEVAKGKSKSELKKDLEAYGKDVLPPKVDELAQELVTDWTATEDEGNLLNPEKPRTESSPESIARGRALFMNKDVGCFNCHGEAGRGNGPSTEVFKEGNPGPGLYDDWKNPLKPRDLTSGIYRGGRRPLDIYRRIRAGIKGAQMQAFSKLSDEEVWDLVNYVLSIPYQAKQTKHH